MNQPSNQKSIPAWVWIFPILFGILGALISWAFLRKRSGAGYLIIAGFISSTASSILLSL